MATDWRAWESIGWTQRDLELLRAHGAAIGIEINVPAAPPRWTRRTTASDITPPTQPAPPRVTPAAAPATPVGTSPMHMPVTKRDQNYINHIVIVMDASGSMSQFRTKVIQITDELIKGFAVESEINGQETRVTVVLFNVRPWVVIYDKDVLRMPSIADHYRPDGGTALIDATMLAIDDLKETPQKYGDHAFLMYVITDGEENSSMRHSAYNLKTNIAGLATNWTFAALVPSDKFNRAIQNAQHYGFPAGNIKTWDTTSVKGVEDLKRDIQTATTSFMTARASGTRAVTNLFVIDSTVVNAAAIKAANLKHVPYDDYNLVPIPPAPGQVKPDDWDVKHPIKKWVAHGGRIDEFVQNVNNGNYAAGQAFYALVEGKTERIQPDKLIAIVNKNSREVYFGRAARDMLKLPPNMEARVKPGATDEWGIYVQSKAPNRKLVVGSHLLIFNKVPRESDYR